MYITLVQYAKLFNLVISTRPRRTTVGPGRLQLEAGHEPTRQQKGTDCHGGGTDCHLMES